MAARQYIGARYVPLYVGDWDATVNYEPLTVVSDSNGNSFTSLKDVPAGTPLTDRNYWIQTSSFSGAVDQLQRRMSAAEDDISSLDARITTIEESDAGIKKDIIVLCDSYGNRVNDNNKRIYEIVADTYTDRNVYGIAVAGGSIGGGTLASALDEFTGERNEIGYILLISGANEQLASQSVIVDGSASLKAVCDTFPNAKVKLMCSGLTFKGSGTYTVNSRINLKNAYKTVAAKYGYEYITNSEYILCNTELLADDLCHPNAAGVSELARQACLAIVNGSVDVSYTITVNMTFTGNYGSDTDGYPCVMSRHNGVTTIKRGGGRGDILSYVPEKAYNGNYELIGKFPNSLICEDRASNSTNFMMGVASAKSGSTPVNGIGYTLTVIDKQLGGYILPPSYGNYSQLSCIGYGVFID